MNEHLTQIANASRLVIPEIILLATVCLQFLAGPFLVAPNGSTTPGLRNRWGVISAMAVIFALWTWWQAPAAAVLSGPFRVDELTWFIRGVMLAGALLLILVNWTQIDDARSAESFACLLAIAAGVNFVALANDLVTLFLALELISIPTYLFLLLPRRDAAAQEAALKYFLISVFSSGILLYGFSLIYGMAGTTNLPAIQAQLSAAQNGMPILVVVGMLMVLAGLAFRLTAVPFHFYAPDVFQGAPVSAAALLAFVPKVAGFVALLRLLSSVVGVEGLVSGPYATTITGVVWWLAVLTMFLGNLLGVLQADVRRLLAYSGVSHVGFMLVGLYVGRHTGTTPDGIDSLLFYLAVYGVMTLGAFAVLVAADRSGRPIETLDDLAGLGRRHPELALMMLVFMLSMTGLPPTAGFLAKLNLFFAAWSEGTEASRWLAVWMVVNAAIGAWYYLRVIGVMYLREPGDAPAGPPRIAPLLASAVCTVATLALFFAPASLWTIVHRVTGL